jgi:hypothetical protein
MKIFTIIHKETAVTKYRQERPLIEGLGAKKRRSLLRKNEKIRIDKLAERLKKQADIWNIKYIQDKHTLDLLYTMRNHVKSKVVIDFDDNIWEIPEGNVARGDMHEHLRRGLILTASTECADWVTVSTEPLKALVEPINNKVVVLPNYIDPTEWKHKRAEHKKVRIGWVWSPTHIPDNKEVEDALRNINKKYVDKVEIVVFGTDKNIFDFDTVNIPGVPYAEYPKTFMEAGIDISLGPLADNRFNRCKSNIKWMESTMAGAAFIGSKVYPYSMSVKQGETGYVCNGTNQWVKHISHLIEDPCKRIELIKNARKDVLKRAKEDKKKWNNFYMSI